MARLVKVVAINPKDPLLEISMSLFGNPKYQYRETYFILFENENRPSEDDLTKAISELGDRFEIKEIHRDQNDQFESMTVVLPVE